MTVVRRRKKISKEEEEEIQRSIELADLVKPKMDHGLDVSLFTKTELDLMEELEFKHEQVFRKRAEELRFYPDTLNQKERSAVFRCMTYDELKPFYRILAIKEKNVRLQKMLAMDKVDIRKYTRMTIAFSGSVCDDEKQLPDISIAEITQKYFAIMHERDEICYEMPFYFFSDSRREQILKNYARSISLNSVKVRKIDSSHVG